VEVIVREGSQKKLCKFLDEEFVTIDPNFFPGYTLGRRYTKGNFCGDFREELILSKGNTAYIMANTDMETAKIPSSLKVFNYRTFVAIGSSSYCYYPYWFYDSE
jgi:hypothetical protein